MEENDGFSGQLIYTGKKNTDISLEGIIEGVEKIERCSCAAPKYKTQIFLELLEFPLLLVFSFVIFRKLNKVLNNKRMSVLIAFILCISYGGFMYYKKLPLYHAIAQPPSKLFE